VAILCAQPRLLASLVKTEVGGSRGNFATCHQPQETGN
jgi:hypothetical protein